jgi:hypothetical protein
MTGVSKPASFDLYAVGSIGGATASRSVNEPWQFLGELRSVARLRGLGEASAI